MALEALEDIQQFSSVSARFARPHHWRTVDDAVLRGECTERSDCDGDTDGDACAARKFQ